MFVNANQSLVHIDKKKKKFKKHRNNGMAPPTPDINPIENLWPLIEKDAYENGKQYSSK